MSEPKRKLTITIISGINMDYYHIKGNPNCKYPDESFTAGGIGEALETGHLSISDFDEIVIIRGRNVFANKPIRDELFSSMASHFWKLVELYQ